MDGIFSGSIKDEVSRLREIRKNISSKIDGGWDLALRYFADGPRIVESGTSLPMRKKDGSVHTERNKNSDFLMVRLYSDGTEVCWARVTPDWVEFAHPYEILAQPSTARGLSAEDVKNNRTDLYSFHVFGPGIFQKDKNEYIEMPGSAPVEELGIRPRGLFRDEPHIKVIKTEAMQKEDVALLRKYLSSVYGELRRADELLVKL